MATNIDNITIVGQAWNPEWNGLNKYSTSEPAYAGSSTGSSAMTFTTVLKFITPDFIGESESITFNISMYKGVGENPTLRYALCTSDSNISNYQQYANALEDVVDENQFETGIVSWSGLTIERKLQKLTISTTKLQANTTYYLFLYAYDNTGVEIIRATSFDVNDTYPEHSASIDYNSGVIYIDNGESFDAYLCYIDNGVSWDLCVPYIDNGTSWDIIS